MDTINPLFATLLMISGIATANDAEAPIEVQSNQAVVQVKGIVCSFCAHGTEQNLAELKFLDASRFGGNGVLIDINTQRITLALIPDRPVDFASINAAILKGGYDPVATYVRLRGVVQADGDRYLLTSSDTGQIYMLTGHDVASLVGAGDVFVLGHLDTGDAGVEPIAVVVSAHEAVL